MIERPQFKTGALFSSSVLNSEQAYRIQRARRHWRHLHGWGIVCGLHVVPAECPERPLLLFVCPGYALGPHGDEIYLPERASLDVRDHLWKRPRRQADYMGAVVIRIRYAEESLRLEQAKEPGCGCEELTDHFARLRDGVQLDVSWATQHEYPEVRTDVCRPGPVRCPDCPESPFLRIARVNLPKSEWTPITVDMISNCYRR